MNVQKSSVRAEGRELLPYASSQDLASPSKRPGCWRRFWDYLTGPGWLFELLSIGTSFLCIAAIIGILAATNSREVKAWNFRFTINSTIAALGTVYKGSITLVLASCLSQMKWLHFKRSARQLRDFDLYDRASRGPLGSFAMLWHALQRWASFLAAVGALATVLSLLTDTAIQQLVGQYSKLVEVDGEASFPVCLDYDGGTESDAANGGPFWPTATTADKKMQGAIYNGIFNFSTTSAYTCASTCEWNEQPYVSLGFSSNCSNVTDALTVTATEDGYHVLTPHNISFEANYSATAYQLAISVQAVDLTVTVNPLRPEIVRFGVLRVPVNRTVYTVYPDTMEAYECTLGFVGFTYANLSSNGTLFTVGHEETTPLGNGTYIEQPSTAGDSYIVFNQSGTLPDMTARVPDIGAITQLFTSDRFSGDIYEGEGLPNNPEGVGAALMAADIPDSFAAMAASMTTQLRQSKLSTAGVGTAVGEVSFVSVRWGYLALPAVVQVLATGLLVMTWWRNRQSSVLLWKESTVAMLYHYVVFGDDDQGSIRTNVKDYGEMDELARRTVARLD